MTEGLVLREGYAGDDAAKRAFLAFLERVHGLDLSTWDRAGYWNDDYRQLSFFNRRGAIVSSVSVYSVDLVVDGGPCRAAQLSGVGTLPAHRRRGLNRRLTEAALDWASAEHDVAFLFADEEALPFYARCGFQPLSQQRPSISVEPVERTPGLQKVEMDDPAEREALFRAACLRAPVSDVLGAYAPELLMFHALYGLRETVHYIPDLDVHILFKERGGLCTIHDVVGPRIPPLAEILPYIATPKTREVAFRFVPDKLDLDGVGWSVFDDDNLCDRGDLPLRGRPFLFPATCHA